jgi:hypothetical protein
VTKTGTQLSESRVTVSNVLSAAYTNHGKTTSTRETVGETQHGQKEIVVH